MGEAGKNQGDKKSDNKNGDIAVVLKLDTFCEGCLKKVVQDIDGVKEVEVDLAHSMLMVVGKVDPAKIREKVAEKTKKVDIIFPQPKKDGGDKKKADENKKQPADQDKKKADGNKKQPADQDKKKADENKKQGGGGNKK